MNQNELSEREWSIAYLEDGVVIFYYKPNVKRVTLEIAKSTTAHRIAISDNIKRPALLISEGNITVEREAKKYFETDESTYLLAAIAIIVSSPLTKFAANAVMNKYMPFKRTKAPFKVFLTHEKDKALAWLSNYKLENLN